MGKFKKELKFDSIKVLMNVNLYCRKNNYIIELL